LNKLFNATTAGSLDLTGRNLGLLKTVQDTIYEIYPNWKILFFCHVIHQEALCKTFRHEQYEGTVVELSIFLQARGLNHRWFIFLLQQMDAERTEVSCYLSVQWLSSGEVLKLVQDLHEEIIMVLDRQFEGLMVENLSENVSSTISCINLMRTDNES
jgi:hypothetical protein